ncbi:putative metal-dependent hydrolase [Paenibacillus shirakamiensis]|uniref:Metal-dependent hydrolase n=1 Tax=Paenibacillus shirakamiensis TaxID=1265935 RepID=A0ABS4JHR7_9BACL|nr:DUF309 domain-containing protein [Paenibacillus shirakamiensis]MBP2001267.1 putative metal-dependent hydrolase [Paenibacillus shirakamiensis]
MSYDPLFVAYLIYFNRDQDYFECHEVLEELWLKENRNPLIKGLLQVAVGMFHFRRHNLSGSRKMLRSAAEKLAHYPGDSLGINLGKLRDEVYVLITALESQPESPIPYYDIQIEMIDIHLQQAVARSDKACPPHLPLQIHPQRGDKHALRDQLRPK